MADFDIGAVLTDMKDAASGILSKDITQIHGFAEAQWRALAKHGANVALGIATGEIEEDEREFFLGTIDDLAWNLIKTLKGLMTITIEKVWNAVVEILHKAVSSAIDAAL